MLIIAECKGDINVFSKWLSGNLSIVGILARISLVKSILKVNYLNKQPVIL